MLVRPARIAFTSQPSSTMPASNFSSMKKSWKALRLAMMLMVSKSFGAGEGCLR
jgi:hypothetical protein